ncbi:23S rRNA maturation mini-RNase III [Bradyrhizobium sp. LB7.2]
MNGLVNLPSAHSTSVLPSEFEALCPPPQLLPGENIDQYHALQAAIFRDLDPQSAIEWLLGANFHGQKRKNDTHASTSDPDSRLYRKAAGREAKLCYMGHATMENRHGLAVAGRVTHANGTAERRAAEVMLKARRKAAGRRITAGEDKAYDTADHVANLRAIGVTPHVTQNQAITKTGKNRNSAIDERTTRHPGYGMSQSRRAMVECIFGWGKQHGTMRKTKHRGIARVAADFLLNLIAYNLIRIPKLLAA